MLKIWFFQLKLEQNKLKKKIFEKVKTFIYMNKKEHKE